MEGLEINMFVPSVRGQVGTLKVWIACAVLLDDYGNDFFDNGKCETKETMRLELRQPGIVTIRIVGRI